jgi:hypothetical protein
VSVRLGEEVQEMLRRGDCELNRAAQYLIKIVSQCREQARRMYYGAVFEIKKEILIRGVMEKQEDAMSVKDEPGTCPKCSTKMLLEASTVALPGFIDPRYQKDSAVSVKKVIPVRCRFCPKCRYVELFLDRVLHLLEGTKAVKRQSQVKAPRRTISAAGKKRIAAAARARWAKFRAAKKK